VTRRRLVRERRAQEDLAGYVDYFVEREFYSVAEDFIAAYERFCELVVEQPEMAHRFETESERLREFELRIWPLGHHFPHLVFYYLTADEIRIYAVLHGHMDREEAL
jgi:plasmid stabilization system protein ParE